jgi:hypothetical protein
MGQSYRQIYASVLVATAYVLHAPFAQAGNSSFIIDAPIGRFTDEDVKLMNANIERTVVDTNVRVVHSWSNPITKYSGTAETLLVFAGPDGVPCKRVRIANRAGNLKGQGQYTLCKVDGKDWTFVPNDYAPQPKADAK